MLIAPWTGRAETLLAARRWKFAFSFLLGLAVLDATGLGLGLWADSVRETWRPGRRPAAAAVASRAAVTGAAGKDFEELSVAAVWRDWHRGGPVGPGEILLMLVPAWALGFTALLSWLLCPALHTGGSIRSTWARACRIVASRAGLLLLLGAIVAGVIIWLEHLEARFGPSMPWFELVSLVILAVPSGLAILLLSVFRAAARTTEDAPNTLLSPRCEACGYDLTHVPAEGRCPECGAATDDSLLPGRRRPGWPWQRTGRPADWLAATAMALFRPGRFYGALRVLTADRYATRFVAMHLAAIAGGTFLWMKALLAISGGGSEESYVVILFALLAPLSGFLLYRFVASAALSVCFARGLLPDPRWARRILAYEVVFLWAFCAFNGTYTTVGVLFGNALNRFLSNWVRIASVATIPMGPFIWLSGTAALVVLWLARYRTAVRQTRWANY